MVRPTLSVVPAGSAVPVGGNVSGLLGGQGDRSSGTGGGQAPGMAGRSSLSALIKGSEWTGKAVCAGSDPDMLFVTGAAQRDAAKICQACPVRLECLADALDNRVEYGVWGGMTERQRRAVLKKSPEVTSWRSMLEEARSSVGREAAS